jgi:hypothetical protein
MPILEPGKAEQFAAVIAEHFPVPRELLSEAVSVIRDAHGASQNGHVRRWRPQHELVPGAAGWRRARDSMAEAILASATPERDDRLFPGDPKQFEAGALGLAYGAAGVLYVLHATGAGRHPEHEDWLVERATNPEAGTRLGLYDGLHGVAYALDRLGRRDDARRVLDICRGELEGKWHELGLDLSGGLAGAGLTLLHFGHRQAAADVAQLVADRLGDPDGVPEVSGGEYPYAGLIRGSSGPALLFIRLYEETGDEELLDLAATALRQDLHRCVPREDGSLEVNEGWRTMPYLADGSIGIGMVLEDYLEHREDEAFREAAAAIHGAAEGQFYIEPGLFWGRAGMILYLSRSAAPGAAAEDPLVASQVRRLGWHACTYRDHIAFPGEQLLRLSMDMATGTAGVLLALGAALHDEPVNLPFLDPPRAGQVALRTDPAPAQRLLTTAERR